MTNFKKQAVWSERDITFEVAACTNHIEGTHGRLNEQVKKLHSLRKWCAKITSPVIDSASSWSDKVQRGWSRTKGELKVNAHQHKFDLLDRPESALYEKGLLPSRRSGRQVP
jgi:hypothetical protein